MSLVSSSVAATGSPKAVIIGVFSSMEIVIASLENSGLSLVAPVWFVTGLLVSATASLFARSFTGFVPFV